MFRTGRVCLCVVVGRCGGEVFLEPVRGFCGGLECTEWVENAMRMSLVGLKVLLSASAGVG